MYAPEQRALFHQRAEVSNPRRRRRKSETAFPDDIRCVIPESKNVELYPDEHEATHVTEKVTSAGVLRQQTPGADQKSATDQLHVADHATDQWPLQDCSPLPGETLPPKFSHGRFADEWQLPKGVEQRKRTSPRHLSQDGGTLDDGGSRRTPHTNSKGVQDKIKTAQPPPTAGRSHSGQMKTAKYHRRSVSVMTAAESTFSANSDNQKVHECLTATVIRSPGKAALVLHHPSPEKGHEVNGAETQPSSRVVSASSQPHIYGDNVDSSGRPSRAKPRRARSTARRSNSASIPFHHRQSLAGILSQGDRATQPQSLLTRFGAPPKLKPFLHVRHHPDFDYVHQEECRQSLSGAVLYPSPRIARCASAEPPQCYDSDGNSSCGKAPNEADESGTHPTSAGRLRRSLQLLRGVRNVTPSQTPDTYGQPDQASTEAPARRFWNFWIRRKTKSRAETKERDVLLPKQELTDGAPRASGGDVLPKQESINRAIRESDDNMLPKHESIDKVPQGLGGDVLSIHESTDRAPEQSDGNDIANDTPVQPSLGSTRPISDEFPDQLIVPPRRPMSRRAPYLRYARNSVFRCSFSACGQWQPAHLEGRLQE